MAVRGLPPQHRVEILRRLRYQVNDLIEARQRIRRRAHLSCVMPYLRLQEGGGRDALTEAHCEVVLSMLAQEARG